MSFSLNTNNASLVEARELFKLAIPLALTHLSQMAIGLTDTVMLGRYDETALAASVLGNTVYLFCWFIGLGPTGAVSPMIAQVLGARPDDREETRRIVRMGLWSAALISLPLMAVLLFTPEILLLLGQDANLAAAAGRFVLPLSLGLPCSLGFQVLRNFAVAKSRPQPTFLIMVLVVLVNLVGDYALIFGHFGMPRLGLVGSGIASAFSLLIGFIGMAAAIAFLPGLRGSRLLADFARPDWAKLSEIVRLGLPISLMTILESGFYLALHLVVGLFGAVAVAAHAIAWNVQTLTSPVHTGIGVAASVRVGLAAGANDKARIRRASWTALFATIVCAAPLTAVIALFARPIAGLYLAGPPREVGVIGAAVPFLLVAAAYQVVDGLQGAAVFVLRGLKDVQIPTWIVALCFWGVGSPTCLGLAFTLHLGALGVWLGLAFTLVVTAAMLCARLRRLLR